MMNQISCVNWLLTRNGIRHFSEKVKANCSQKIYKHFLKIGQTSNLELFPSKLKRVTSKKNSPLYIADQNIADKIAIEISRYRNDDVPLFEINSGPCILTRSLLNQLKPSKFGLIERNDEFREIQTVTIGYFRMSKKPQLIIFVFVINRI